ncbi:MAG: hypothetical protein ABR554_06695 [Pyrinomonadaceae bacterium]
MNKKIYSALFKFSFVTVFTFTPAASNRDALARARNAQPAPRRGSAVKPLPTARAQKTTEARIGLKLTEEESGMVRGSRAAIIAAGFSAPYFDSHFALTRVVNTPGDRRVVWRFTVGEYSTVVSDSLGFYTDAQGRRVDTHSAGAALRSAHDVLRVIPRRRAERLMRSCIGAFTNGAVVLQAEGDAGHTALVFVASSVPKPRREDRAGRREREEREERVKRERAKGGQAQVDEIEAEDEEGEGAPIFIGAVNLETGRCTKGEAIVDHPVVRRKG